MSVGYKELVLKVVFNPSERKIKVYKVNDVYVELLASEEVPQLSPPMRVLKIVRSILAQLGYRVA